MLVALLCKLKRFFPRSTFTSSNRNPLATKHWQNLRRNVAFTFIDALWSRLRESNSQNTPCNCPQRSNHWCAYNIRKQRLLHRGAHRDVDELLMDSIKNDEKCFLKLDLQGFELEALAGAENILKRTEVILTEVSFYAQAYDTSY